MPSYLHFLSGSVTHSFVLFVCVFALPSSRYCSSHSTVGARRCATSTMKRTQRCRTVSLCPTTPTWRVARTRSAWRDKQRVIHQRCAFSLCFGSLRMTPVFCCSCSLPFLVLLRRHHPSVYFACRRRLSFVLVCATIWWQPTVIVGSVVSVLRRNY